MKNLHRYLILLVLGVFIWVIVSPLMQDGMFTDGILYAAVSRNLALGLGTFWNPHFSSTLLSSFHEQPPLMFGLQSIFFKLIGDSIYPERIYSLLMGILTLLLIAVIWRQVNVNSQVKKMIWLPQFLWLIIPTVPWGLVNNVEENTMVVFDLLSVLFLVRLFEGKNRWLSFLFAVAFLFAASFTKGIQGLFPLAVPACYWVTQRSISFRKMLLISFLLLAAVATIYFVLLLNPAARESYHQYFLSRFSGFPRTPHATTGNRFYLLSRLFIELGLPLAVCIVCVLFIGVNNFMSSVTDQNKRTALFFSLIGLTASVPLLISFEQRGFYLITCMPFFAISFSLLLAPSVNAAIEKVNARYKKLTALKALIVLFLFAGIIFTLMNAGKIKRDKDILNDVYVLKNEIGTNQTVNVSISTWQNWSLHNYLQRYDNISLAQDSSSGKYFMRPKKERTLNLAGYLNLNLDTKYLDVYKRNE